MTPPAFAPPLRRAFYGSRLLSQTGQGLFLATVFLAAGSGDAAALKLSGVFVAMMVSAVALSLPGGALADRLGPVRGMALGAVLRFAAIAFGLALIGHPQHAWVIALVYSAASQVFSPAELAMVGALQPRRPGRTHAALLGFQYAGLALGGFALAPALYLLGGTAAMAMGALVCYAAVTVVALWLERRLRSTSADFRVPPRQAFALGRTLRFFRHEPRAAYAAGLMAFGEMAMKSSLVAVPFYFRDELQSGQGEVVTLVALGLLGSVLGFFWTRRALTLGRAPWAMRLVLGLTVVALLALGGLGVGLGTLVESLPIVDGGFRAEVNFAVAVPAALVLGLCFSATPIGGRTVLTELAPLGQQARVFAAQAALTDLAIVLPLSLAGLGTEWAGARATFLAVGAIGLGVLLLLEQTRFGRRALSPAVAVTPYAAQPSTKQIRLPG